ncbi:DNA-binding FadR family transcriptional regulator [Povalibacter uvarum]|uniref:DNA-binding FadR family transcriptional regulator n=1 Tax=Povalibacter uvarum TaxID=732238 RepID=A0A841HV69_9GAMM|nr:FadR/GntR family transcriptional regulator [Povalibacter uvarum]MBB6096149.1 DNA-binding FadR family transcriptional regulator [Povalibacter uvarum]
MRKPPQSNVTHAIVEQLGHAVVARSFGTKDSFPIEAELCKQFGVSRTVLREAVKMLTAKGLLRARPRQGTWVQEENHWNLLDPDVLRWLMERKFSLQLLAEFTEIRLAIEPMAAMIAATKATPASIAQIRNGIHRMKMAEQGDDDPLESDIAFHVAILHATGNRFYSQLEDVVDAALRISIAFTNRYKGVALADIKAHTKVLDHIEAGQPKRAHAAMTAIIEEVMELIGQARKKSPQ